MDRIKGLKDLIKSEGYRKALGLPTEPVEHYTLLAQGEYNINYVFTHPVNGKKLLLRVNCGSQMHLADQISYEYQALKLLERSRRTPKVLYVDGSKTYLDHGILVMEYLPGIALSYEKDLGRAAEILSDIHSMVLTKEERSFLIEPDRPLSAILTECEDMVKTFMESPLAGEDKKRKIRHMLSLAWEMARKKEGKSPYKCLINTELNSTNFLISEENGYLIDWEKPLYGDPAQDLGHFLAPTTTFWKTDVILGPKEVEAFLMDYIKKVNGRFDTEGIVERTMTFIPITCLRGITWCAMAWVEYQDPDKLIVNSSTMNKLTAYLSDEYLDMILGDYLRG